MDKWAHLGHRLGECWTNNGLTFINIPKNASSFVKGYLLSEGWQHSNSLVDSRQYLVILRDPVDRWLSGIAQYQFNSSRYDMDIDSTFKEITFDDHTELQSYFLQSVDLSKTAFLKFDDNLKLNLIKYFKTQGHDIGWREIPNINSSAGDRRGTIKATMQEYLANNPGYMLQLKKHFAADYELINKVTFYD
jgi:hypothetical protein